MHRRECVWGEAGMCPRQLQDGPVLVQIRILTLASSSPSSDSFTYPSFRISCGSFCLLLALLFCVALMKTYQIHWLSCLWH